MRDASITGGPTSRANEKAGRGRLYPALLRASRVLAAVFAAALLGGCLLQATPEPRPEGPVRLNAVYDPVTTLEVINQQMPLITSGGDHARLQRIGARLARNANLPASAGTLQFILFDDGSENAWALPPGIVAVSRGLLLESSDAQLAAVLGHMIAHVKLGHHDTLFEQVVLDTVDMPVGTADAPTAAQRQLSAGAAQVLASMARDGFAELRYTPGMELEADHEGAFIMAHAGYDPREAVSLWERIAELQQQRQRRPMLMIVHDGGKHRIKRLQRRESDYLRALGDHRSALENIAPAAGPGYRFPY